MFLHAHAYRTHCWDCVCVSVCVCVCVCACAWDQAKFWNHRNSPCCTCCAIACNTAGLHLVLICTSSGPVGVFGRAPSQARPEPLITRPCLEPAAALTEEKRLSMEDAAVETICAVVVYCTHSVVVNVLMCVMVQYVWGSRRAGFRGGNICGRATREKKEKKSFEV